MFIDIYPAGKDQVWKKMEMNKWKNVSLYIFCWSFRFALELSVFARKQSCFSTFSFPLRSNSQQRFISLLNFRHHLNPKKIHTIVSHAKWNEVYDCLCWSFCWGNLAAQNKKCIVSNAKNIDFNCYLASIVYCQFPLIVIIIIENIINLIVNWLG